MLCHPHAQSTGIRALPTMQTRRSGPSHSKRRNLADIRTHQRAGGTTYSGRGTAHAELSRTTRWVVRDYRRCVLVCLFASNARSRRSTYPARRRSWSPCSSLGAREPRSMEGLENQATVTSTATAGKGKEGLRTGRSWKLVSVSRAQAASQQIRALVSRSPPVSSLAVPTSLTLHQPRSKLRFCYATLACGRVHETIGSPEPQTHSASRRAPRVCLLSCKRRSHYHCAYHSWYFVRDLIRTLPEFYSPSLSLLQPLRLAC